MGLHTSNVSKCLDKKLLIAGFEIPEILLIFFLLAVLNFIFGSTSMKFFLVWIPPAVLAIILKVTKRGKPDNYLLHLVRYHVGSKYLSAFPSARHWRVPPKIKEEPSTNE